MTGLLNVLVVEDSENDAQLLLEELRQKGCSPLHERVEDAAAFTAALERRAWDVVVSDYVMPQFSGPEALHLLRERGLDVPFIVVSGTYGEEAAVDMMKAGANDYIVKSNLSRLVPAIEREMAAAQSRRARARAESALRHLAAIVESTDDAICSQQLDGTVVSWNRAAERIFGYRADEIVGHSIIRLFPRDQQGEWRDIQERAARGESIGPYETWRRHKDGRAIPVSVTISPLRDGAGQITGVSFIGRDITARRQSEAERAQLIRDLTLALRQVRTLTGLLPICASCKRIRDDRGYWQQVETYISEHTNVMFSHGICPDCLQKTQVARQAIG